MWHHISILFEEWEAGNYAIRLKNDQIDISDWFVFIGKLVNLYERINDMTLNRLTLRDILSSVTILPFLACRTVIFFNIIRWFMVLITGVWPIWRIDTEGKWVGHRFALMRPLATNIFRNFRAMDSKGRINQNPWSSELYSSGLIVLRKSQLYLIFAPHHRICAPPFTSATVTRTTSCNY